MTGDHWLWRLDAAAWIAAARHELALGSAPDARRRKAITHARRGAGMALNGVLVHFGGSDPARREQAEHMWGRSYLDHLRALAGGDAESLPSLHAHQAAASEILAIPVAPPPLVQLGGGPDADMKRCLALTQGLVEACATYIEQTGDGG